MIRQLLSRWADASLKTSLAEAEMNLEIASRKLTVAAAEIEALAAVIARDRQRVHAESSRFAREQAEAEGVPQHGQPFDESIRSRFA